MGLEILNKFGSKKLKTVVIDSVGVTGWKVTNYRALYIYFSSRKVMYDGLVQWKEGKYGRAFHKNPFSPGLIE